MKKVVEKELRRLQQEGLLGYLEFPGIVYRKRREPRQDFKEAIDEVLNFIKANAGDKPLKEIAKKIRGLTVTGLKQVYNLPAHLHQKLLEIENYYYDHGFSEKLHLGQLIGLVYAGILHSDDFDECLVCKAQLQDTKAWVHRSMCNLACKSIKGKRRHDQVCNITAQKVLEAEWYKNLKETGRKQVQKLNQREDIKLLQKQGMLQRRKAVAENYDLLVKRRLLVYQQYGALNTKYKDDNRHKERIRKLLELGYSLESIVRFEETLLSLLPPHIEFVFHDKLHRIHGQPVIYCKKHGIYEKVSGRITLEDVFAIATSPDEAIKRFGCIFCRLEHKVYRKTRKQDKLIAEVLEYVFSKQPELKDRIVIDCEFAIKQSQTVAKVWDLAIMDKDKLFQSALASFELSNKLEFKPVATLFMEIDQSDWHVQFPTNEIVQTDITRVMIDKFSSCLSARNCIHVITELDLEYLPELLLHRLNYEEIDTDNIQVRPISKQKLTNQEKAFGILSDGGKPLAEVYVRRNRGLVWVYAPLSLKTLNEIKQRINVEALFIQTRQYIPSGTNPSLADLIWIKYKDGLLEKATIARNVSDMARLLRDGYHVTLPFVKI